MLVLYFIRNIWLGAAMCGAGGRGLGAFVGLTTQHCMVCTVQDGVVDFTCHASKNSVVKFESAW